MHKTLALIALLASATLAQAQDACPNRGDLDPMYCDANKDLLADTPKDPAKHKNPSTLVFTYTPVEDPAKYENIFKPFTDHLAQCTGKRVVFYQVQNNAAQIEAMRSGRLHVGGFSTGPTVFAVNKAGAIPFAVKGDAKGFQGYNLITIVKASSAFQKPADLKGKKSRTHLSLFQLRSLGPPGFVARSRLVARARLRDQVFWQTRPIDFGCGHWRLRRRPRCQRCV